MPFSVKFKPLGVALFCLVIAGCAVIAQKQLDDKWGVPEVRDRTMASVPTEHPEYHRDIQPIFDKRCVTCHACYDGPCQLKLSSYEGLDRGASKEQVYDGTRFLAAEPSRLGVDAKSTVQWRERDYFPVLNERVQTPEANLYGSMLYRMLELKKQSPLPNGKQLDSSVFDFSTSRAQECPSIEAYDGFARSHPEWGMPFGLPALNDAEFDTIKRWLEVGAPVKSISPLDEAYIVEVAKWEAFFNGESNKEKLFSRYAFEHLFLGHLWFESLGSEQYFRLVRSRTPSGQAIDEIASRRPFDDPGNGDFYYRLRPVRSSIVDKTHMPYRLSDARMAQWREWFLAPDYSVESLPGYAPDVASNPFRVFKQLPASARYKFMLEEAEYTIMGYIKGPVCRGQVALNVIRDHFWVFFVDPDVPTMLYDHSGVDERIDHLRLPAAEESNASPFEIWKTYSKLQEKHLGSKLEFINEKTAEGAKLSIDLLWDGDGHNRNAALTIFRHFDNATVVKGLQGPKPKTAWVISYSLLERIHYLLVAGFDVYGNVGHQLNTRLYMDFLRMEGESQFLMFLPEDEAEREFMSWYDGAEDKVEAYINILRQSNLDLSGDDLKEVSSKQVLFDILKEYLGNEVLQEMPLIDSELVNVVSVGQGLNRLAQVKGRALQWLPELSIIRLSFDDGSRQVITLAVNRDHKNVSSLFLEEKRLKPEGFTLTLYPGVLGSYPNTFYDIQASQLGEFSTRLASLESEENYGQFLDDFAVRRTSPRFWDYFDDLDAWYRENQPLKAGIIDLNRLENR